MVLFAALAAHWLEILLYALAYWLLDEGAQLGWLAGEAVSDFNDYLYFSATSYTTLGVGDIYPTHALRLLAAAESLNGLLLIGWSASYTYLSMHRFWNVDDTAAHDDAKTIGHHMQGR
ncbi:MAG TPA: potassium channel family protein [Burkholderiales bacterium]|nr:potassium channel family protein [Burkholderiales bacterium]